MRTPLLKKLPINFWRIFLLLSCVSLAKTMSYGQSAEEYGFRSSRTTYIPLVGGNTGNFQGNADEGAWQSLPIGFNFSYEGVVYTTASASTNGFVRLGADVDLLSNNNANNTNGLNSNNSVPGPVLAPLWDDLATSSFSYLTEGSAPNRVFTMEWQNVKWWKGAAQPSISFQVKLYEGSNKIQFIYNPIGVFDPSSASSSTGIAGNGSGTRKWISIERLWELPGAFSTTSFSNNLFHPYYDLLYEFNYELLPEINVLYVTENSFAMSWGYGSSSINYVIEESVGDNLNFQPIQQTSTGYFEKAGLIYETKYYYRIKRLNAPYYSQEVLVYPHRFSKYSHSAYLGQFVPLSGPNVTQISAQENGTNRKYLNIPLGFDFFYAGTSFNKVQAAIYGSIFLTNRAHQFSNFGGNPYPLNTGTPILFPLGDRLNSNDQNYKVSYETTGSPGNRICTIEWLNLNWNYLSNTPGISFQAKLYENNGKIEFIYKRESGAVNPGSQALIGVKGYGTDRVLLESATPNPKALSNGNNPTTISKPLTGQIYAFEYNGTPAKPRVVFLDNSSVTLFWGNLSSNIEYKVQQKIGVNGSYSTVYTGTNPTGTFNLLPGVNFFRLQAENSPISEEISVAPTTISQQYSFPTPQPVGVFTPLGINKVPGVSTGDYYGYDYYNNLPIGFPFTFSGVTFTTVSATRNGMAVFGEDFFSSNISNVLNYVNPLTSNFNKFLLSPLGDFLEDATFSYSTTGAAPARVFTMEWLNARWSSALSPVISFQVKLHETSGKIEYIYQDEGGMPVNANASIGMRQPNNILANHIISLQGTGPSPTISYTTESSNLSIKPINGQIYRFLLPNIAPKANNQSLTTNEDTNLAITLTGSDDDGNPLLYIITDAPDHGVLVGTPPFVTYKPNPNYFGPDSFKFKVNDVSEDSPEALVSINVLPVNDAPTSADVSVTTPFNTAYTFLVPDFNYIDVENDAFSKIRIVSVETAGKLEYNGVAVQANTVYDFPVGGLLIFKPGQNESGDPYASFTFKVQDAAGLESNDTYVVQIKVPFNNPPTSSDFTITTPVNVAYTFSVSDFNFTDVEGDAFTKIRIVSEETFGDLEHDGMAVTSGGEYVFPGGILTFISTKGVGNPYTNFTFQVQDASGQWSNNVYTASIIVDYCKDFIKTLDGTDYFIENLNGWQFTGQGSYTDNTIITLFKSTLLCGLFPKDYKVNVNVKASGPIASVIGAIDFNQDGQFTNDEVVLPSTPIPTNQLVGLTPFKICNPNMMAGKTRFRIISSNKEFPSNFDFCMLESLGEVEDYTIEIDDAPIPSALEEKNSVEDQNKLTVSISPNPSSEMVRVTVVGIDRIERGTKIQVYNLMGEVVLSVPLTSLEQTLAIGDLRGNSVYLVKVIFPDGNITFTRLIKE